MRPINADAGAGFAQSQSPFTDDPLIAGVSAIRAIHITELRTRIDLLRAHYGLPAFSWTDPLVSAGVTPVRAQHVLDLRSALSDAYAAAGLAVPSFTDSNLTSGVALKVLHISELRAAVTSLESDGVPLLDGLVPEDNSTDSSSPLSLSFAAAVPLGFGTPMDSATIPAVPWITQLYSPATWSTTKTCGPTSAAMVTAYAKDIALTEALVHTFVNETSGSWPAGGNTSLSQIDVALNSHLVTHSLHSFNAESLLKAMQDHHPVIAPVNTVDISNGHIYTTCPAGRQCKHFMVIVGITPDSVIVNDPGRGAAFEADRVTPKGQGKSLSLSEFVQAWHSNSGVFNGIEVIKEGVILPPASQGDFLLEALPANRTISQGDNALFNVTLTATGGFADSVSLRALHLPGDLVPLGTGFDPRAVSPPGTSSFSLPTNAQTPTGTFSITIEGTNGDVTKSSIVSLTVTASSTAAPNPTTASANAIGSNVATLSGAVNPNGLATTAWFEWGVNTNYDRVTDAQSVAAGTSAVAVSRTLTGLVPNSAYHYRLVAMNSKGTTPGSDRFFTTVGNTPATTPSIDVSPGVGTQLTRFAVTGGNYTPSGQISRFVQIPGQPWQQISSITATAAGTITTQWPFEPGCNYPTGTARIYAIDVNTGRVSRTITEEISTDPLCHPAVTSVFPNSSVAGTFNLTITGTGFDGGAIDQVYWKATGAFIGNGTVQSRTSTQIVVTEFMTGASAGTYQMRVKNSNGTLSAPVDFQVTAPPVTPVITSVSPNSSVAGTFNLTITGTGFDGGAIDQVYWKATGAFIGNGTVQSRTSTQIVVTEFMTGASAGTYQMRVKNSNGTLSAPVDFQVTAPQPTLLVDGGTSSSRRIGQTFTFTGSGYTPNRTVTRYLRNPNGSQIVLSPTLSADGSGKLSWPFTPTTGNPLGSFTIWVVDDATGRTSNTVTETVTAAPAAEQLRYLIQAVGGGVPLAPAEFPKTYISGIERGQRNPGLNSLNRLAGALGITLPAVLSDLRQPRRREVRRGRPLKKQVTATYTEAPSCE